MLGGPVAYLLTSQTRRSASNDDQPSTCLYRALRYSEVGMIRLETLIELKILNYPLIKVRQTVLHRAIRGNSISVNSTLPPSLLRPVNSDRFAVLLVKDTSYIMMYTIILISICYYSRVYCVIVHKTFPNS